jgi:hypothetical protein
MTALPIPVLTGVTGHDKRRERKRKKGLMGVLNNARAQCMRDQSAPIASSQRSDDSVADVSQPKPKRTLFDKWPSGAPSYASAAAGITQESVSAGDAHDDVRQSGSALDSGRGGDHDDVEMRPVISAADIAALNHIVTVPEYIPREPLAAPAEFKLPPLEIAKMRAEPLHEWFSSNGPWMTAHGYGHWTAQARVSDLKRLGERTLTDQGLRKSAHIVDRSKWRCPAVGCEAKTYKGPEGVLLHINKHLKARANPQSRSALQSAIPEAWLRERNLVVCSGCHQTANTRAKKNAPIDGMHPRCHRAREARADTDMQWSINYGDGAPAPSGFAVSDQSSSAVAQGSAATDVSSALPESSGTGRAPMSKWAARRGAAEVDRDPRLLPTFMTIAKARGSLERRVPKPMRQRATALYCTALRRAKRNNTEYEWKCVAMFWKVLWWRPKAKHTGRMAMFAERLERWSLGDFAGLWRDFAEESASRDQKNAARKRLMRAMDITAAAAERRKAQLKRNARRCEQLVKLGEVSKALQALTSEGVADLGVAENVAALRSKHPAEAPTGRTREVPDAFRVFDVDELDKWLKKLKWSSSGGLDQFSVQYLLDCAANDDTTRFKAHWLGVANLVGKNGLCDGAIPFIGGASLTALKKKGGGVRPVAAGCLLRRCVGALLAKRHVHDIKRLVGHGQFGVDVADGTLCAAIAFEEWATAQLDAGGVAVKADFENAFNMISRARLRKLILNKAAFLAPYFDTFYAEHTALVAACDVLIWSQTGTQQGDPLGSYLFALFLEDIIRFTHLRDIPNLRVAAYHDDIFLIGSPEACALAMQRLDGVWPSHGSRLKPGKSHWFGARPPASLEIDVTYHAQLRTEVLGTPVGDSPWLIDAYQKHVDSAIAALDELRRLDDNRVAHTILRQCLSACRVTHLLRARFATGECAKWQVQFDAAIREGYERIVGAALTPWAWKHAQMSVKEGGGGVHTCQTSKSAAFVAAHTACARRLGQMGFGKSEEEWTRGGELDRAKAVFAIQSGDAPLIPDERGAFAQSALTRAIMAHSRRSLMESADAKTRRDMVCSSRNGSSAWLNANLDHKITFNNAEWRIALQRRHFIPFAETVQCGPATGCPRTMDPLGRHAVACKYDPGRINRHNAVTEVIANEFERTGAAVSFEVVVDGSQHRPGDIAVKCVEADWRCDGSAFERTCFDIGVSASIYRASTDNGAVIHYSKQKTTKARDRCAENGVGFVPLITDVHGWWAPEARAVLKKLVARVATSTGQSEDDVTHRLNKRLGTVLQLHNSRMCLTHCVFKNEKKMKEPRKGRGGVGVE